MTFKRIALPVLNDPSPEEFNEFLNKNQPVLIKNSIHWKLMNEFSLDKIAALFGNREYITYVSTNGMWADESTFGGAEALYNTASIKPTERKLSMLTASEFIQRALNPAKFPKLHFDNEILYLICGAPKTLAKELKPALNFLKDRKTTPSYWMSTKDSISQTHVDNREGLLVQIMGRKKVILFDSGLNLFPTPPIPNNDKDDLYLLEEDYVASPSQMVNPELATEKNFPGLSNLIGYECELSPGDIIYIPFGWWHYVRSLDFSISFNLGFEIVDIDAYELVSETIKKIPKSYYKILFKNNE